jgi:hypothetical protein
MPLHHKPGYYSREMIMAENVSPRHFNKSDAELQAKIKAITGQIQAEIKRLSEHPLESSGNPSLYKSLKEQILSIKNEIVHLDYVCVLDNAVEKLQKAETTAKNQEILAQLRTVNEELLRCRNVRA